MSKHKLTPSIRESKIKTQIKLFTEKLSKHNFTHSRR